MEDSKAFEKLRIHENDVENVKSIKIESYSKSKFCFSDFTIIKELGKGAYAKLYLAIYISSGKQFALKCIDKKMMIKEDKLYQVYIELELLQSLESPFIAKAYGGFEENDKLFIVLDYYDNGDLFDFIRLNSKVH